MLEPMLIKYAELVIKLGVNLQQGQTLVISTPLECAPFVRTLTETAYAAGAREVAFFWQDEQLDKIKYLHAPADIFSEFPNWQKEFYLSRSYFNNVPLFKGGSNLTRSAFFWQKIKLDLRRTGSGLSPHCGRRPGFAA
jgi:hypothetical protein